MNNNNDQLDVKDFMASPRHGYHFLQDVPSQKKILNRAQAFSNGKVSDKHPIVNIQFYPNIIELHDGNATAVAWVLYRQRAGLGTLFNDFYNYFPPGHATVLYNRINLEAMIPWHPYVPMEVSSRGNLQTTTDREQGNKLTCIAVTKGERRPVYFNDLHFFAGDDSSDTIERIVEQLMKKESVAAWMKGG